MPCMTSRERVLTAMRRDGPVDRFPFEISWGAFTPGLMDVYRRATGSPLPPDEYFDFDTRSVDLNPTRRHRAVVGAGCEPESAGTIFDEWGVGMVPGPTEHFVEFRYHPLAACETPRQVDDYDWPDVTEDYRYAGLAETVAHHQARGYAVTGELYQTIFEMAWLLRGLAGLGVGPRPWGRTTVTCLIAT